LNSQTKSTDYGDGRVYCNVSIGELRDGNIVRVTDYWASHSIHRSGGADLGDSEDVRPHADEVTKE
jgi:hypothetical protein